MIHAGGTRAIKSLQPERELLPESLQHLGPSPSTVT